MRLRKADPFAVRFFFGLTKPKKNILGGVLYGEGEAIGSAVKFFKVDDLVFGATGMGFGAYAEYNVCRKVLCWHRRLFLINILFQLL